MYISCSYYTVYLSHGIYLKGTIFFYKCSTHQTNLQQHQQTYFVYISILCRVLSHIAINHTSLESMSISNTFLAVFVLVLFVSSVLSQEEEDERKFEYIPGPNGPENWGHLQPEWYACSTGKLQSPINIITQNAIVSPTMEFLDPHYQPSNAILKNRGHDITVEWPSGAGWVIVEGTNFTLRQVHWHSPSEHAIDYKRYDLEAHMVHISSDGKIAVIGILYKSGPRRDAFLGSLENQLKELSESNNITSIALGNVGPMHVEFQREKYFRFSGSLTTPACTEGVTWTVLSQVRDVQEQQVKLLREAVHDGYECNARPIQNTNGRVIYKFKPAVRPSPNVEFI